MAKATHIEDLRPIVLYDAQRQKAIGIFKQQATATKYLFGNNNRKSVICGALKYKHRILNSLLKPPIAIRYANPEQIKLLGEEEVLMLDESLKKFDQSLLLGFHTTRKILYEKHVVDRPMKRF